MCEKSSIAYMKRIDAKLSTCKMTPGPSEVAMIRRGHQGGSSELLSSSQQRHMDAYFMAELKRLGCDLPYEQFCDVAS